MGLDKPSNYLPRVRVSGAGERIINNRLTSWERIDAAGTQSDQLTLHIDTTGQTGLPKEGAVLTWQEGYGDNLIDKGQFKITRIVPKLFPPRVTIVATAAPFQVEDKTGFKERCTRTFENVSLADLFRQVVTPHGFSPRVAKEFESVLLEHMDQIDETDSAFLTRIARERDAIAKPVNDLYVLAKRGQVKTITGQAIPPVVVGVPSQNKPSEGQFINCQLDRPSRRPSPALKPTGQTTTQGKNTPYTSAPHRTKNYAKATTTQPPPNKPAKTTSSKANAKAPASPSTLLLTRYGQPQTRRRRHPHPKRHLPTRNER